MVAATFEKAITYIFAEPLVWDREVGGSNPLAPTKNLNPIDNLKRRGVTTPIYFPLPRQHLRDRYLRFQHLASADHGIERRAALCLQAISQLVS